MTDIAEDTDFVLLVEDDPRQAELFGMAWGEASVADRLVVASDACETFAVLRTSPETRQRPRLVLLDLNLPGKPGHEILAEIRLDASLAHLRVVILSTSSSPSDVDVARRLGADGYITKPLRYSDLVLAINRLAGRWLDDADSGDRR